MRTGTESLLDESGQQEIIRTTLYDLIEVLNAEVKPGEENLVVATVVYLLKTGRITFA